MLEIIHNPSLRSYNTMGVDARARALVEWESAEDLRCFFTSSEYSHLASCRVKPIGAGSNLLFVSAYFDGVLLRCTNRSIETKPSQNDMVVVSAAAGVQLDELVGYAALNGWWGIENLSLVPGTVGAAAVQNPGAYGVEFGEVVTRVDCYDLMLDRVVNLTPAELHYGYRDSAMKHAPFLDRMIVLSVELCLSRKASPKLGYGNLSALVDRDMQSLTPGDIRAAVSDIRRSKLPDPIEIGSAGSFFKNPVITKDKFSELVRRADSVGISECKIPAYEALMSDGSKGVKLSAAWLIDRSGWKNFTCGNVATWHSQPLVLVNQTGLATGAEVASLAADISADVFSKWGVSLTPEVEYL